MNLKKNKNVKTLDPTVQRTREAKRRERQAGEDNELVSQDTEKESRGQEVYREQEQLDSDRRSCTASTPSRIGCKRAGEATNRRDSTLNTVQPTEKGKKASRRC